MDEIFTFVFLSLFSALFIMEPFQRWEEKRIEDELQISLIFYIALFISHFSVDKLKKCIIHPSSITDTCLSATMIF